MEALLDFSQPFNYPLFVQVVEAYQQTEDYALKQKAADTLRLFQDAPQSSHLCMNILSQDRATQAPMVTFFGFSLMETFIKRNWYIIQASQQHEICTYIMSFASQCLSVDGIIRRKYLTLFTLIALYTYPSSYSTFLSDLLSMRTTQLDKLNSITILTSFLEDFQVRSDLLTGQKMAIDQQLTFELPNIFLYILEVAREVCIQRDIQLITLVLKLLIVVCSFCDNIVKAEKLASFFDPLVAFLLEALSFSNFELYCLALRAFGYLYTSIKASSEEFCSKLATLFYQVFESIDKIYNVQIVANNSTKIFQIMPNADLSLCPFSYCITIAQNRTDLDQKAFLSGEALFSLSFFLRNALETCLDYIEEIASDSIPPDSINVNICLKQAATKSITNEKLLNLSFFKYRSAIQLLVAILTHQKINNDLLEIHIIEFFSYLAKKVQSRNLRRPAFKRMDLYTDILTAIQLFCILFIPAPIEVYVYVDEYGNVLKRELDDSEQLSNFSAIGKTLEASTRAIKTSSAIKDLLTYLSKQFSTTIINAISWSLPFVARAIKSPDSLVITTINHLVDLSSILVSIEHKICIAGGIVYICSQLPLFIDTKEKIFIIMLRKMLYFTSIPNDQLKEMSVRCFALLIKNIKGNVFFDSIDFKDFLRELVQMAMHLPPFLIIVLYESISSRVGDASRTFMDYVGPLMEMLDAALFQWPPENINTLSTITTIFSIFRGICEGIRGKVNGEIFASSYSHFMGRTFRLYKFINDNIYSSSCSPEIRNVFCTVKECISNYLEALIMASTYDHIRVWFINVSVGTNVPMPDSNSVRDDMLLLLKSYKQGLCLEKPEQTNLLDVKFVACAHALFRQIVNLSSDADQDDIISVYFNDVLGHVFKFLVSKGFCENPKLTDVFIESICQTLTECSSYIRRKTNEFLRMFLEFVPPIIAAISDGNVFYKHYQPCLKALTVLVEMLTDRFSMEFDVLYTLFTGTIKLLNKSTTGKEYSILSSWWKLLKRSNEPDIESKVLFHILPSLNENMINYFKGGLTECNEAVIRDLYVVLRMVLWF